MATSISSGGAIGQESSAPLGNGLYVLLVCCIVLGIAKFLIRKINYTGNRSAQGIRETMQLRKS